MAADPLHPALDAPARSLFNPLVDRPAKKEGFHAR